jgi:hypothetical protein
MRLVLVRLAPVLALALATATGSYAIVPFSPTSALAVGCPPRYEGMGQAGIAVADDAGALDFNPAGLALLDLGVNAPHGNGYAQSWLAPPTAPPGTPRRADLSLSGEAGGEFQSRSVDFAGYSAETNWGYGLAWHERNQPWFKLHQDDAQLGFARRGDPQGSWAWGVSVNQVHDLLVPDRTDTLFNAGALFKIPYRNKAPLRVGLTANDLGSRSGEGVAMSLGAAVPLGNYGGLVLDWVDFFDKWDAHACIGYERWGGYGSPWVWRLGYTNMNGRDHKNRYTAGAGYVRDAWTVSFAWTQNDMSVESSYDLGLSRQF